MFTPIVLRRISTIVLFAFTSLTLQPLQAAVMEDGSTTPAAPDKSQRYGQSLEKIRDGLQVAKTKQEQGQSPDDDIALVRAQKAELDALEADVEADFAAVGQHLRDHNLPTEILARHEAAVAEFQAKKNEFKQKFDAFEAAAAANDLEERKLKLKDLADYMQAQQHKPTHAPTDPNKLPFRIPDESVRPPIETVAAYKATLFKQKPIHLAANGSLSGITLPSTTLPATPTEADLAETEDIQLTDAIKAQAQALDHNPVKIHNWVRNNIEFIPTYGSIQGADLTLQTKRGNAFDTASLEIALLRAAGIPARYVYGTIQIPAEQAMNWVGGVDVPGAVQSLMSQGGIPNVGVTSGGLIKAIRLEHVWVEAWVDYVPSRGAVNKSGDTWVPLDPSYKQYQYNQGMNLKEAVPLDAQALITQAHNGATINQTEGWVQNLNNSGLQTLLTDYQAQLKTYIDNQKSDATVGDVLGNKTIQTQNPAILMGTLPYKVLATGARMIELPGNLRYKFHFNLYASIIDKELESSLMTITQSLPQLSGKKVSLVYEAATPADKAVIDNAYNTNQTSLPAYLIHVKPVLKVEGVPVATGPAVTMATPQLFTVNVVAPGYSRDRTYQIKAGDLSVLGINPAGITADMFDSRTKQHDLTTANDPDFSSEMLNQIILAWWGEKHTFNDIIGATNHVINYQLPSHGLAAAPLNVHYFFGIPRSASYKSRVLDVKEDLVMVVHRSEDNETRRKWMLAVGAIGSYLEAGIYDQAFLMKPGYSMSTITALKAANDQSIPIYTIDSTNAASLNAIQTDPDDLQDMRNAVAAGLRVTTSQRDITVANFTGLGYILEDPQTGEAAYLISGGRNGGDSPSSNSIFPVPQVPASPILGIMLRSSLRAAGASLIVHNGVFVGLALSATAGTSTGSANAGGGGGLAALISILAILSAYQTQMDKEYPLKSQPLRLRKYSTSFGAIRNVVGLGIRESKGPDLSYGDGVYLALQKDPELAHIIIDCPPQRYQAESIAAAYQIPNKYTTPDWTQAVAYVDVVITRDNYYIIDEKRNDNNVTEMIVRSPLIPVFETDGIFKYLYFGPYSQAIDVELPPCL